MFVFDMLQSDNQKFFVTLHLHYKIAFALMDETQVLTELYSGNYEYY